MDTGLTFIETSTIEAVNMPRYGIKRDVEFVIAIRTISFVVLIPWVPFIIQPIHITLEYNEYFKYFCTIRPNFFGLYLPWRYAVMAQMKHLQNILLAWNVKSRGQTPIVTDRQEHHQQPGQTQEEL